MHCSNDDCSHLCLVSSVLHSTVHHKQELNTDAFVLSALNPAGIESRVDARWEVHVVQPAHCFEEKDILFSADPSGNDRFARTYVSRSWDPMKVWIRKKVERLVQISHARIIPQENADFSLGKI